MIDDYLKNLVLNEFWRLHVTLAGSQKTKDQTTTLRNTKLSQKQQRASREVILPESIICLGGGKKKHPWDFNEQTC